LSDEDVACVTIEVGHQLEQQTEITEDIEVVEHPIVGLKQELLKLEALGLRIDAKV
jgi:hypothetical protein